MVTEHASYREFLKQVLVDRQSRNRAYSLRALAKGLGMAPSTLSDVFSGRRKLSSGKLLEIAHKLGLSPEEAEYLQLLGQYEDADSPKTREWAKQILEERTRRPVTRDLSIDQFKLISVWYHYAILELMDTVGFELSARVAAKKLGITDAEADLAIGVLSRLELIQKNEAGKWVRMQEQVSAVTTGVSSALRKFYAQMLEKTSAALDTQTPEERISGSQTLAFDPEQYGEMKELMNDFLDKAAAISAKGRRKTRVYHLSTHFFNLVQK